MSTVVINSESSITVVSQEIQVVEVAGSGIQGPVGAQGPAGVGVPSGGTTGQVLAKINATDYNTEWVAQTGGGGAVDSVNGQTGVVVLSKADVGLGNVDNTTDLNKPISTATQSELNTKQNSLTGFNNALFYQFAPGNIQTVPQWAINPLLGLTQTPTVVFDGGTGEQINNLIVGFNHDVASPDKLYSLQYNRVNTDTTNTGNAAGTNGRLAVFLTNDFVHESQADIGEVSFINNSFNIGLNAAGPIDVNGFSYAYGFGNIRNNVTIKNSINGYGFQPSFDTGSLVDANSQLTAFYDNLFAPDTVFSFYTGLNLSPSIGGIQNDKNMNSISISPQVGEMFGNASYLGLGMFGTFGDFDTGNYQGIAISPNISSVVNAVGLDVNMSNVVGTNVTAARFTGDVDIFGDLNFTGALSIGKLDAFAQQNVVDGGFVPTTIHGLISAMTALDGVTTANADIIGVNTASIMLFEQNSITTSGGFGLGTCALALPAVVETQTGSSVQHVRAAVFALNLDASSTGGTIQNLVGCRAVAIPNGVTTVNKYIAFEADLPFGDPTSGDSFGFFSSANVHNFFRGSVCIGSTQEKVTNSSVGLEVASTTKAILNSRMTTAERDALTAVNGMQVYNLTTDKLQVYAAGSWVDLH